MSGSSTSKSGPIGDNVDFITLVKSSLKFVSDHGSLPPQVSSA